MINFKSITAYIKIIRPANTVMTGIAVALGVWLTGGVVIHTCPEAAYLARFSSPVNFPVYPGRTIAPWIAPIMLALAAMAATAYGNVINDIRDIKSDRVSHPNRPLVDGTMTPRAAKIYAADLAAASLACAWMASTFHLFAATAPLILLTLYSIYFKRTRVVGNIVVSTLTAYAILFGALPRPEAKILILPAVLAFLLNFCRELVKDVQDADGDRAAGWTTSADLRPGTIKALIGNAAGAYILLALAPSVIFGHFGMIYTIVCLTAVIPIHIYWSVLAFRNGIRENAGRIGALLKLEMAAGLAALAGDFLYYAATPPLPISYIILEIVS